MGAFTTALSERARAGVKVDVLIDAVGGDRIDGTYIRQMTDAGVEVKMYHPLKWWDLSSAARLNNRTHRKLLVIDGKLGFTGGVGVADVWSGDAQDPRHWRDTHYRVTGPVVADLQAAFADHWLTTDGQVLQGDDYFPKLEQAGTLLAQEFKSASDGSSDSMQLMYLLSITAASRSIRLATAYFVPDDLTIRAPLAARRRGVRVQVVIPGKYTDVPTTLEASRASWGPMLKAGVESYEYEPTMYHWKMMVVDDLWTSIGSANLDNRSFRLNGEANLNVLDAGFAAEQAKLFEADLRHRNESPMSSGRSGPGGSDSAMRSRRCSSGNCDRAAGQPSRPRPVPRRA